MAKVDNVLSATTCEHAAPVTVIGGVGVGVGFGPDGGGPPFVAVLHSEESYPLADANPLSPVY
ncbi:MAG: hypothetical protein AAB838_03370, partial [Patescibacteria group bacterium]